MGTYATIITAIDTAIEDWAGKPVSLSIEGRSVTYRSLTELLKARQYYARLESAQSGKGFKITNLKATSAR